MTKFLKAGVVRVTLFFFSFHKQYLNLTLIAETQFHIQHYVVAPPSDAEKRSSRRCRKILVFLLLAFYKLTV